MELIDTTALEALYLLLQDILTSMSAEPDILSTSELEDFYAHRVYLSCFLHTCNQLNFVAIVQCDHMLGSKCMYAGNDAQCSCSSAETGKSRHPGKSLRTLSCMTACMHASLVVTTILNVHYLSCKS